MFTIPPDLSWINSLIINLAIIIATILTYYFVSLYIVTNQKKTHLSFVSIDLTTSGKFSTKLMVGTMIGFIAFIVSLNRIPLLEASSVDMRYVFIFFAVIYGSDLMGLITTSTLVALKTLAYLFSSTDGHLTDYLNNLFLSFFLLILVIILNKYPVFKLKKRTIFLVGFILFRYFFSFIIFHPFTVIQKQLDFLFYALIFSLIFLIANYIIEISVSISQSVHVYRTAAIYDGLTGVYNKESFNFFLDFVASLNGEAHKELSISVIDIDNFKEINDNYGHPVGDQALKYFSKYMKKNSIPLQHYICRIGGDEFAIIHNQSTVESEEFFTKFLHDLATNPFHLNDTEIPLSLSIGMTHFKVSTHFNTQQALEAADAALYHAKKNGKNKIYITSHTE